ncbi:MAG: hypothetical protein WCB04_08105 [Mycobacteriales bacterium]
MLILGLLLLLVAVLLTAGMLLGNTGAVAVEVFGFKVSVFSIGELFTIGVATGIIAGLSLGLVLSGMRRASRKRRERRAELKTKRSREQELQDENARLARELEQQRRSAGPGSAVNPPTRPETSPGDPAARPSPGAPDATKGPLAPPAGSGTGFERPGTAPSPAPDVSQEGRRPLS